MANSWETAARKLQKDPWRIASLELKKRTPVETGIGENIARGFKKSSLAAPFVEPVKEEAATFGGRLSELIGELAGDIPAMTIGGSGGALAGAALGAPLGPIGAGVGALLGGGAGSLMAPTAVKSITREVKSRTPWEEAAANIAADLGQSALIGGLTAGAGKAAGPLLGRIGGKTGEKILSTGLGRGATELAGEVAGMTTAQHSLGEPINAENIAQNILLSGAMKGAHGIGSKLPVELPEMPSLFPKASALKKETFQKVRDYVGERAANIYKSQVHWQEQLQKAGGAEKFTDKQLEDMIYYRQHTGGPEKGDTFEAVKNRMSPSAKKFVDDIVGPHLDRSLQEWNDNPYTHDIKPREALKDIYLPGLYEGTPDQFDKALTILSNRFKTKNPFSNQKTFLTYNEALKEAGLKPRYTNIVDLMKQYDKVMIKSAANAEFASKMKKGAIVRPTNKKAYDTAKKEGWVPFYDPYLRRSIMGKKPDGKFIFSTSELPALVNPEMAPALQGVFSKEAYRPESQAWKYYDAVSDRLKNWAVHMPFLDKIPGFAQSPWSLMASPFHAFNLIQHAQADFGTKMMAGIKSGRELSKNKEVVADAIKHGLQLHRGDVGETKNYLFGNLQPSMKLGSYNKFVQKIVNDLSAAGTPPDEAMLKSIKNQAADYANNVYGGQNWEIINWFNNKNNLKKARRATGYLDWSVSNIKNAAQFFGEGYQGSEARKMWAKYGLAFLGTRAIIDAFNSSLVQTDDKDKSPLGIRLDPEKFMNNLSLIGKPGQRYLFHLPDVDMNILGHTYNPGRDEKGHKQMGHFGKSALEIYHYFERPLSELFSKSNPVFQQLYKQVTGTTPSEYGPMYVQRGFKGGQAAPWGGEEGYKQLVARAKELGLGAIPFSLRAETPGEALQKYLPSLGGMYSINKGLTPFKAKPYIHTALKTKDYDALKNIRDTLLENGYDIKEINKRINTIKNDMLKSGELV